MSNPTSSVTQANSTSSSTGASQTTITCPQSNGQIYIAQDGAEYIIECAYDRYGGDEPGGLEWTNSLEACIEMCESQAGCVNVSWISGTPGPCYLKNSLQSGETNSQVWGARKAAATSDAVGISTSTATATTTAIIATSTAVTSPQDPSQSSNADSFSATIAATSFQVNSTTTQTISSPVTATTTVRFGNATALNTSVSVDASTSSNITTTIQKNLVIASGTSTATITSSSVITITDSPETVNPATDVALRTFIVASECSNCTGTQVLVTQTLTKTNPSLSTVTFSSTRAASNYATVLLSTLSAVSTVTFQATRTVVSTTTANASIVSVVSTLTQSCATCRDEHTGNKGKPVTSWTKTRHFTVTKPAPTHSWSTTFRYSCSDCEAEDEDCVCAPMPTEAATGLAKRGNDQDRRVKKVEAWFEEIGKHTSEGCEEPWPSSTAREEQTPKETLAGTHHVWTKAASSCEHASSIHRHVKPTHSWPSPWCPEGNNWCDDHSTATSKIGPVGLSKPMSPCAWTTQAEHSRPSISSEGHNSKSSCHEQHKESVTTTTSWSAQTTPLETPKFKPSSKTPVQQIPDGQVQMPVNAPVNPSVLKDKPTLEPSAVEWQSQLSTSPKVYASTAKIPAQPSMYTPAPKPIVPTPAPVAEIPHSPSQVAAPLSPQHPVASSPSEINAVYTSKTSSKHHASTTKTATPAQKTASQTRSWTRASPSDDFSNDGGQCLVDAWLLLLGLIGMVAVLF